MAMITLARDQQRRFGQAVAGVERLAAEAAGGEDLGIDVEDGQAALGDPLATHAARHLRALEDAARCGARADRAGGAEQAAGQQVEALVGIGRPGRHGESRSAIVAADGAEQLPAWCTTVVELTME